jgi:hypothetical protein
VAACDHSSIRRRWTRTRRVRIALGTILGAIALALVALELALLLHGGDTAGPTAPRVPSPVQEVVVTVGGPTSKVRRVRQPAASHKNGKGPLARAGS